MDEWESVEVKRESRGRNTLVVNVTENHIRRGTHYSGKEMFGDPVSLAIQEATNAKWAMSGWGYARTGHDNNVQKTWALWPFDVVRDFLRDFDSGRRVSPIQFNCKLDGSVDKTPKVSTRKPRRKAPFVELQARLDLE